MNSVVFSEKILLISPNHQASGRNDSVSKLTIGPNTIPLDLGYIGTLLKHKGKDVRILLAHKHNLPLNEIEDKINEGSVNSFL